jgi:hypothetical protein
MAGLAEFMKDVTGSSTPGGKPDMKGLMDQMGGMPGGGEEFGERVDI